MTFPAANAIYRRETYDNYPAARAILQVVYEGLQLPMDLALRVESRWFAKILRSPQAAAMIRSLFVSLQELNKGARRPADVPPTRFRRVGVIGAGFMGAGIAYVTALAGIEVVLIDRDQASADRGKAHSQKLMTEQVDARPRHAGRARRAAGAHHRRAPITARSRIATSSSRRCSRTGRQGRGDRPDRGRYRRRGRSSAPTPRRLPITSLAKASKRPEGFIGIHFFSPVERMLLVEIIMGKETGDAALADRAGFCARHPKTPIVVNDSRGFYASRVVGDLYARRASHARRGRARGDDRERRPHGRHAGRPARAQRRGRGRPRLEDRQGDRGRSRRQGGRCRGRKSCSTQMVEKRGPARAQERQGLL